MQSGAVDHIALDVKDIDTLLEVIKAEKSDLLDSGPDKEKIEFCERL